MGTLETLMTLPVRDWEVVVGKFLGSYLFLLVGIVLTLPLTIIVGSLGPLDWGTTFCGYLGLALLGATYLAIGLWVSSLTENQIVAFIGSAVLCTILFLAGVDIILTSLPRWIVPFMKGLSVGSHFDSVQRGVIDSRDAIYYLSMIGFFLFLNARSVEDRMGK